MKKNTIKVSVILAVYNAEDFLSETIESILKQSFKNFELIIINDCSTDNSLKIIKDYIKKNDRIVLINNKNNVGRARARNTGLKIAKGEYICVIDADDIALPKKLEIQSKYLDCYKDVFLVGTGAINIDNKGKIISKFTPICSSPKLKRKLEGTNCMYHPTIMFRNEGFLYREKFIRTEDYDFYLVLLSHGKKLANINDKLLYYRKAHEIELSRRKLQGQLFLEKAKEFYQQRRKFGRDEYPKFVPEKLLNIDVENSHKKIILRQKIRGHFKINNFKKTRKFCKKYFKYYGIWNKFLIYYLLSFTGKRFVDILRKVIFLVK